MQNQLNIILYFFFLCDYLILAQYLKRPLEIYLEKLTKNGHLNLLNK